MSWLTIRDSSKPMLASSQSCTSDGYAILAIGSLVFDFDFSLFRKAPCRLVHFHSNLGWQRRFTIFLNADYSISVETQQGISYSHTALSTVDLADTGQFRLTFAWDAPRKFGLLTVDQISNGLIHQVRVPCPVPLPIEDAFQIVHGSDFVQFDERLISIALNEEMVPIGPVATISSGTVVETEDGPRAIERLAIGDLVQTKDSGLRPIRAILGQDSPAMGHTAPLVIRSPYFGLINDIVVAGDQRMLFTGFETEYNLGLKAAFLEAHSFVDHPSTSLVAGCISTNYYQILFDFHECIQISGAWVDSLFVGSLKNFPDILASTILSGLPPTLIPTHKSRAHAILHNYEKQVLLESLPA